MAAMNPDLCGLHERLAWPLLRELAGSPGLHLQTNLLCFLPVWDFLVARNLERFTKAGKRVLEGAVSHFQGKGSLKEQCPTSRISQDAAEMLE